MEYRKEIDGLRAVAVVPVILFHAGWSTFSGGFIGVDIFFVISGYLITAIILREQEAGTFTIVGFYERRARRILPALFLVMLCCLPLAWWLMFSTQLVDFSESLMAVSLFSSNILFWLESGYFDWTADEKPLLHTWSLSVEEQFYLFFPLFLLLFWRVGKLRLALLVSGIAVLSLLLCEYGWRTHPEANFYLAPTRAWELMLGALCAIYLRDRTVWPSNLLSILGLALITYAVLAFDEATPFPSVYALIPVLGTVLIILFATPDTWTGRLLAMPLLVGIGLVSYSAYLWHQPLFAFIRTANINPPPPLLMAALIGVAFALSYFSWKFVEVPLRQRSFLSRRTIFAASGVGLVAFMGLGVGGLLAVGQTIYTDQLINFKEEQQKSWDAYVNNPAYSAQFSHFSVPREDSRSNVLITGDSHSKDIFNALWSNNDLFEDRLDYRRVEFNDPCYPKRYLEANAAAITEACLDQLLEAHTALAGDTEWVLISLRWASVDRRHVIPYLPSIIAGLTARGYIVAIADNAPEFGDSKKIFRKLLSREDADHLTKDRIYRLFFEYRDRRIDDVNDRIRTIALETGALYMSKLDYACDMQRESCEGATPDLRPLHYDYGHYTLTGAQYYGRLMHQKQWFAPLMTTPEPAAHSRAAQ